MPFSKEFYLQPTLAVAEQLLGQYLVYNSAGGQLIGEINEVESYIGTADPACHGARGVNRRNITLFGEGGHAYIYFTYGMYHCLNVVTEQKDFPSGVLIRSIIPLTGIEIMRHNRQKGRSQKPITDHNLTNGPGKICQAYNLSTKQDGWSLITSALTIEPSSKKYQHFKGLAALGSARDLSTYGAFITKT